MSVCECSWKPVITAQPMNTDEDQMLEPGEKLRIGGTRRGLMKLKEVRLKVSTCSVNCLTCE